MWTPSVCTTTTQSPVKPQLEKRSSSSDLASVVTFYSGDAIQTAPSTLAEAAIYPGTVTWGAEDGIYQTFTMSEVENPVINPTPYRSVIADLPNSVIWLPNSSAFTSYGNHSLPYDTCGSMFTGLTPQTTLHLSVRYYVEKFPNANDQTLLSLTRPSPPYDSFALELYSKVLDRLPVAVPVGENPLGEWFRDILDAVATNAGAIGKSLGSFFPPAEAIGGIIGGAAQGINSILGPREDAKGKKKQQPNKPASKPQPRPPRAKTSAQLSHELAVRKAQEAAMKSYMPQAPRRRRR
jgi:hypothetical protein